MEIYCIKNKFNDIKYGPICLSQLNKIHQKKYNNLFILKSNNYFIILQKNPNLIEGNIYLINILDTDEIWFSYFYNNKFYSIDNYELEIKNKVEVIGECMEIKNKYEFI